MTVNVKINHETVRDNLECCVKSVIGFLLFIACILGAIITLALLFGPFLPQLVCGIDIDDAWAFCGAFLPTLFSASFGIVTLFVVSIVDRCKWKFRWLLAVPLLLLITGHWSIGTIGCVQNWTGDSLGFAHVICTVSFIVMLIVVSIATTCLSCIEVAWNDSAKHSAPASV
jgi:hypothetical protein